MELRRFQGRSGKGKSRKTISAYTYRIGLFTEFCRAQKIEFLDQISHANIGEYLDHLQEKDEDGAELSDRTIFNLFQTVNTMLRHYDILVPGRRIMKELDYEECELEDLRR